MKKYFLLAAAVSLFLAGCASTDISSVSAINSGKRRYSKILILSTFQDLMYKEEVESAFKRKCLENQIFATIGSEILPPVRDYPPDEILSILKERKIDGLLIVALQDYWESYTETPSTTKTTGTASIIGNTLKYSEKQTTYPGSIIAKPRVNFDSRFFDGETGQAVWRSTSLTAGNAFADFTILADSLAGATVTKLLNDKIVIRSLTSAYSTGGDIGSIPKDLTEALRAAEDNYKKAQYQKAIMGLSAIKPQLDNLSAEETDRSLLSRAYLLWGSCYIKAWNRPDLAERSFEKVLEYDPNYLPSKELYDSDVIAAFEKYKNDVWVPKRALEEKELKDKNEAFLMEIRAREKDIANRIGQGGQVRIIKSGATLRVKPDSNSPIIKELPVGALLEFIELNGEWAKVKLPPNSDGIVIVGYIHVLYVEPEG